MSREESEADGLKRTWGVTLRDETEPLSEAWRRARSTLLSLVMGAEEAASAASVMLAIRDGVDERLASLAERLDDVAGWQEGILARLAALEGDAPPVVEKEGSASGADTDRLTGPSHHGRGFAESCRDAAAGIPEGWGPALRLAKDKLMDAADRLAAPEPPQSPAERAADAIRRDGGTPATPAVPAERRTGEKLFNQVTGTPVPAPADRTDVDDVLGNLDMEARDLRAGWWPGAVDHTTPEEMAVLLDAAASVIRTLRSVPAEPAPPRLDTGAAAPALPVEGEYAELVVALGDAAVFLRGCRGTEPAEYFEEHAATCREAAAALLRALPPEQPPGVYSLRHLREAWLDGWESGEGTPECERENYWYEFTEHMGGEPPPLPALHEVRETDVICCCGDHLRPTGSVGTLTRAEAEKLLIRFELATHDLYTRHDKDGNEVADEFVLARGALGSALTRSAPASVGTAPEEEAEAVKLALGRAISAAQTEAHARLLRSFLARLERGEAPTEAGLRAAVEAKIAGVAFWRGARGSVFRKGFVEALTWVLAEITQRGEAPAPGRPKTIMQAIRGQRCENGHLCACAFDFGPDDSNVGLQLSAGCCVHGEKECEPPAVAAEAVAWEVVTESGARWGPFAVEQHARDKACVMGGWVRPLGVIGPAEERAGTAWEAEPWPPRDVVQKLADAADHLLNEHDCDAHGYEEVCAARDAARRWLAALDTREPGAPTVGRRTHAAVEEVATDILAAAHALLTAAGVPNGTLVERVERLAKNRNTAALQLVVANDVLEAAGIPVAASGLTADRIRLLAQRDHEGERLEGTLWAVRYDHPNVGAMISVEVESVPWLRGTAPLNARVLLIIVPPEGRAEGGRDGSRGEGELAARSASGVLGATPREPWWGESQPVAEDVDAPDREADGEAGAQTGDGGGVAPPASAPLTPEQRAKVEAATAQVREEIRPLTDPLVPRAAQGREARVWSDAGAGEAREP